MRNFFVLILSSLSLHNSFAQKTIDGLINAEKNFAAYSVAHGTKDAFIKFADSAAIVFDQGKPVNAIETWNKREKRPGVLSWEPQFVEISASKDFGYTTGPWTLTLNDTIVAEGNYCTIWHFDRTGEWKFLVDLGAANTQAAGVIQVVKISSKKHWPGENIDSLRKANKDFENLFSNDRYIAYKKYFSKNSIVYRNNTFEGIDNTKRRLLYRDTPTAIEFTGHSFNIAAGNDLGYVCGIATTKNKQDGFLRIWRREKKGWKIALEVLRY